MPIATIYHCIKAANVMIDKGGISTWRLGSPGMQKKYVTRCREQNACVHGTGTDTGRSGDTRKTLCFEACFCLNCWQDSDHSGEWALTERSWWHNQWCAFDMRNWTCQPRPLWLKQRSAAVSAIVLRTLEKGLVRGFSSCQELCLALCTGL